MAKRLSAHPRFSAAWSSLSPRSIQRNGLSVQLGLRLGGHSSASHIAGSFERRMQAMREIDDEFDAKLGRIGNRKAGKAAGYLRRIRQEAAKAGASVRAGSSFTGSRIGRGRAQGAVLAARGRSRGQRRVVIKARIVRIKSGDLGAVRAHLRYVQRDGVTREGESGELYDASNDRADGKSFTELSTGDRHQFRFIVAPEDSAELADLKPFVRDLMRQMEQDLGTRLDWVAADHFNTGHPHTHIVLRGRDGEGNDLVIAREYIAHGFRSRASELITRELGPETEIELARKLSLEITAERLTRLDRSILRDAPGGVLELGALSEVVKVPMVAMVIFLCCSGRAHRSLDGCPWPGERSARSRKGRSASGGWRMPAFLSSREECRAWRQGKKAGVSRCGKAIEALAVPRA